MPVVEIVVVLRDVNEVAEVNKLNQEPGQKGKTERHTTYDDELFLLGENLATSF